jgi:hypothetical protein
MTNEITYPRHVISGNKLTYTDGVRDGIAEGKKQLLSNAYSESTLIDWYISSIDETLPPIWTEEHIAELCRDFYVIPKNNEK